MQFGHFSTLVGLEVAYKTEIQRMKLRSVLKLLVFHKRSDQYSQFQFINLSILLLCFRTPPRVSQYWNKFEPVHRIDVSKTYPIKHMFTGYTK
jgi:hypothetical protein